MRLIDADDLINNLVNACNDDQSIFFPVWIEKQIDAQPTIDADVLLKEQEKKQITLHKKHVITWGRNDEFSMRKLYEAICETLLDEGELIVARTDDHEKVDFVFYVTDGEVKW